MVALKNYKLKRFFKVELINYEFKIVEKMTLKQDC
jgi:hypothetical protein